MEHTLLQSHLLWGEFSICALCCSYSQSLQFNFLVPPGTHHCWVDRGDVISWEACPTPLHMAGSVTLAAVTHSSTNRAPRYLTSVIWRELVTIWPCAITCAEPWNIQPSVTDGAELYVSLSLDPPPLSSLPFPLSTEHEETIAQLS